MIRGGEPFLVRRCWTCRDWLPARESCITANNGSAADRGCVCASWVCHEAFLCPSIDVMTKEIAKEVVDIQRRIVLPYRPCFSVSHVVDAAFGVVVDYAVGIYCQMPSIEKIQLIRDITEAYAGMVPLVSPAGSINAKEYHRMSYFVRFIAGNDNVELGIESVVQHFLRNFMSNDSVGQKFIWSFLRNVAFPARVSKSMTQAYNILSEDVDAVRISTA